MSFPPRSILVPVESTRESEAAVRSAAALASELGAELTLLGVAPIAEPPRTNEAAHVKAADLIVLLIVPVDPSAEAPAGPGDDRT
jgi:nucleotide-binding universal stress UspA family protein